MSLANIAQDITVIFGSFLVITGVIGNVINILVFSSVHAYRTTPCTFYFLIGSVFDIVYIMMNLISRIVISGVGVDLTRTSVLWCKIRNWSLATISLFSLSCSCLATIDQFFSTSQRASIRRLSSIKQAPRIIIIMVFVWCCHGIPFLLYYDISPITHACMSTNAAFNVYFPSIYILTLNCVIPVSLMSIFGYRAYRNIRLTRALAEQHADRQITRMILIQTTLVVVSYVQYGINGAYTLITAGMSKNDERIHIESFAATLSNLLCYVYFAGSCYVFMLSSSRFRRAATKQLLFWRRTNRINPISQHPTN